MATNDLADLRAAMERRTTADGGYETAVPELTLYRFSAPSNLTTVVYEPSLCIVAQERRRCSSATRRTATTRPTRSSSRSISPLPSEWSRHPPAAHSSSSASHLTRPRSVSFWPTTSSPFGPAALRGDRRESGRASSPRRRLSANGPPRRPTGNCAAGPARAPRDYLPRARRPARVAAPPDRRGRWRRAPDRPRD